MAHVNNRHPLLSRLPTIFVVSINLCSLFSSISRVLLSTSVIHIQNNLAIVRVVLHYCYAHHLCCKRTTATSEISVRKPKFSILYFILSGFPIRFHAIVLKPENTLYLLNIRILIRRQSQLASFVII